MIVLLEDDGHATIRGKRVARKFAAIGGIVEVRIWL